jgi:hypothetical protein
MEHQPVDQPVPFKVILIVRHSEERSDEESRPRCARACLSSSDEIPRSARNDNLSSLP